MCVWGGGSFDRAVWGWDQGGVKILLSEHTEFTQTPSPPCAHDMENVVIPTNTYMTIGAFEALELQRKNGKSTYCVLQQSARNPRAQGH